MLGFLMPDWLRVYSPHAGSCPGIDGVDDAETVGRHHQEHWQEYVGRQPPPHLIRVIEPIEQEGK